MPESKGPRGRSTYGIGRVDDDKKSMHCWIVHIQRKGRVWHRSFSDGVSMGEKRKLSMPPAFRDEVLVSHPPMTRAENASIGRTNNRSGVPGVLHYASVETNSAGPVERAFWIAFWTKPDAKRAIRKFSIAKYGESLPR